MDKIISKEKIVTKYPFLRVMKANILKAKSNYGKDVLKKEEGNELIAGLLKSKEPFMVSRLGETELSCVNFFIKNKRRNWPESIKKKMSINAGFFPAYNDMLENFSLDFLKYIKDVDVMGVWYNHNEDFICREFCPHADFIPLSSIEPYYFSNPWSQYLLNKKVLVIHPFDKTIEMQFNTNREMLFLNKKILPNFELKTLKAVQSIANNQTPFENWFKAYEYMCNEIAKKDFDIAIIGAGAYGLPLASYVKRMGKQAIHMGGATQILFGIKGKRWDNHETISKMYNNKWINPSKLDVPTGYTKVEGGCYW